MDFPPTPPTSPQDENIPKIFTLQSGIDRGCIEKRRQQRQQQTSRQNMRGTKCWERIDVPLLCYLIGKTRHGFQEFGDIPWLDSAKQRVNTKWGITVWWALPSKNTTEAKLRACLHGGGGPQIGEVTCNGSPHLSCKRDQIKMRDYMDRRVTSPTWGPPPPCKQTLSVHPG